MPADRPSAIGRAMTWPLIAAIRVYQWTLSPWLGGQCRFHPTCSRYAEEALRVHGPIRGLRLTVSRVARCQPLCRGGYDPVPGWREPRPRL